ncbi:S-methyl thiohydantoin desulfurase domain-containing protein [Nakamurella alba]|uniref:S-methyl thiohydantoin desulfurase domain-containing protein n=1 Tax=Nakamurella alba TaxID=2665158 RepID=UPI0012B90325|nr:DUF917 domain-containing protein [Nakamurella alba]
MTGQQVSPYVGAAAVVTADDVAAYYEGATFYSPADGNASKASLIDWVASLIDDTGPVVLHRPAALPADALSAAICVIGSGSALADLPPSGDEFSGAVRELEQHVGGRMGAVYPLAAATVSAMAPLAAAADLGVPLLDCDGMGRTFALVHHTAMHLGGISTGPLVMRGATGESVLIEAPDPARADALARPSVEVLGGWAAFAGYPGPIGALTRAALPGTVSRLINVGRLLMEPGEADVVVGRLSAITGTRRIGRGRIVELEHLSRPTDFTVPAHPSSVIIDESGGAILRLELRSEVVAVFSDGALTAAAPDLVCLFDVDRGRLSPLDSLQPGDLVDVLVTPADGVWYSPEALAMVGPASHGIPLDHPRKR